MNNLNTLTDSSIDSLEISKNTEEKKNLQGDFNEEDYEKENTITISPPALKDWSKDSEYDRISKELGLENNSQSDDFSINEKDLDENLNTNIYTDEGFEKIEQECQEVVNTEQSKGFL